MGSLSLPELKFCVIQNEILGKLASSATHLTLLHTDQSSQRAVGRTGALSLLSSTLHTSNFPSQEISGAYFTHTCAGESKKV